LKKKPHILVIASALDIRRELSLSQKWWSLLKGLWSEGARLSVVPFEGKSVETPWWLSQPRAELQAPFWRRYLSADKPRKDNWASLVQRLLQKNPEISTVLYLGVPLEFFGSVAREISQRSEVKQVYVDGEAAATLDSIEAEAAYLDSFAHVFTTQPGHEKVYLGLGAKKVHLFPHWSDPDFFQKADYAGAPFDLMAWGQTKDEVRPDWAESMVFAPSKEQAKWKLASVGQGIVWPRKHQVCWRGTMQARRFQVHRTLHCRQIQVKIRKVPLGHLEDAFFRGADKPLSGPIRSRVVLEHCAMIRSHQGC
jgi:hypothetical protein